MQECTPVNTLLTNFRADTISHASISNNHLKDASPPDSTTDLTDRGSDEKQMGQRVVKERQKERHDDDKLGAKSDEGEGVRPRQGRQESTSEELPREKANTNHMGHKDAVRETAEEKVWAR